MKLVYVISEEDFVHTCADKVARSGATLFEDIYESLCQFLITPIDEEGVIKEVRNRYKPEYYDKHLSLREYINNGKLELYYPSVDLYSDKDTPLDVDEVIFLSFIKIESFSYGGGVKKNFKIKSHNLKTKNRITVEFLHLVIPQNILSKIYKHVKNITTDLIPSRLGVWEWRQTFYDKISGDCYFCECFKNAIQKEGGVSDHPHIKLALSKNSYMKGICHLCSGSNSDLFYCHPMYASSFKVKYGAYIRKVEIEEGLNEKDAENKIRELKGVAKIGEKWINETLLFNYINVLFPRYFVEREASPVWLGNQRLDIFIPELNLAVEYQGQQHFKAVELFGGKEGLVKTKERDKDKLLKCKKNDIDLVYFTYKDNLSEKLVNKRLKKYIDEQSVSKKNT